MPVKQALLNKLRDGRNTTNDPTPSSYLGINSESTEALVASASTDTVNNQGAQSGEETRVYKRRWYILILFNLMCGYQGTVWNTFGPISASVQDAFGWDTGDIGLLTNWGIIGLVVGIVPLVWLAEHKGLRAGGLVTAFFLASGTVVRVFTMEPPAVTILMNLGQALNGFAAPLSTASPPALSAVWFPPHQRTTATAAGTFFGAGGMAASFLIGPLLVPDVPRNLSDSADPHFSAEASLHNETRQERIAHEKDGIRRLMYIECGFACALFLAMIVYFPKKPPLPPSPSASVQREDFLKGLKHICRCPEFWMIAAIYGISQGVMACWSAIVAIVLEPHGIGEKKAGWIGFAATCLGAVLSVLMAILADYMKRAMKWFVLLLYVVGTGAFLVFALAADNFIPDTTMMFAVSFTGGTAAMHITTPLLFELVNEAVYPAGEGLANGVLTLINCLAGGVFLFVMLDPSLGTGWMNWVMVGSCAMCIPILLMMKVRYNRLELDEHNPSLTATVVVPPPSDEPAL